MKYILIIFTVFFLSCSNPTGSDNETEVTTEDVKTEDIQEEIVPGYLFSITYEEWGGLTEISYEFPVIHYNLASYDIEDMEAGVNGENVYCDESETGRIVNIHIGAHDYICYGLSGYNLMYLTETELVEALEYIYSIPDPGWSPVYTLTATQRAVSQPFTVDGTYIYIDGVGYADEAFPDVIRDGLRVYQVLLEVDVYDFFLFMNDNFYNFFGWPLTDMTRDQLKKVSEIVGRYPETGILDLVEEYK